MWFRQALFLSFPKDFSFQAEAIQEKLEKFAFTPCLPTMHSSAGWVAPLDEEQGDEEAVVPLVHTLNGYMMICLQTEDKLLPATVIRQDLEERVKLIESREARRVRAKEKQSLKEELVMTLLPQAFTKLNKIYGYFDPQNKVFVLNSTSPKQIELFTSFLKKSLTDDIKPYDLHKLSPTLTEWLKTEEYSRNFAIEKSCVLQDNADEGRKIRAQQQNLFANAIQDLIKDGCEVKQLGLSWQDRVQFTLGADDCSLRSIQYLEEISDQVKEMDMDTKRQQFDADFFIMTQTLGALLNDLREALLSTAIKPEQQAA